MPTQAGAQPAGRCIDDGVVRRPDGQIDATARLVQCATRLPKRLTIHHYQAQLPGIGCQNGRCAQQHRVMSALQPLPDVLPVFHYRRPLDWRCEQLSGQGASVGAYASGSAVEWLAR
jgi:hypothetical protein